MKEVYEELYATLGDDAEPLELLEVAQMIIDLSDDPYKFSAIEESQVRANYFSADTWQRLSNQAWDILANERINANLDERDFERGWQRRLQSEKLREGNRNADEI